MRFDKELLWAIYAFILYGILATFLVGCTVRKPGQAYPWTTISYAEDDVIYNAVGLEF